MISPMPADPAVANAIPRGGVRASIANRVAQVPAHGWVTLTTWISQAVAAVVQIVAIRLIIGGAGADSYAAYALLVGLQGNFLLADFGIGPALQNGLTEALARGEDAGRLMTTGAAAAGFLWLLIAVGLHWLSPVVAPIYLRHIVTIPLTVKITSFEVIGDTLTLLAVGQIGYKALFGRHRGYWANLAMTVGYISGALALWAYLHWSAQPRLVLLAVCFLGPRALLAVATLLIQALGGTRRTRRPPVRDVPVASLRRLWGRAGRFWILALEATSILQVDYLILSQKVGATEIVEYNIAARIFILAAQLYIAAMNALWPHLGDLMIRGERAQARRTLHRSLGLGLAVGGGLGMALVLGFSWLSRLLDPQGVLHYPGGFLWLCLLYLLIQIWVTTYGTVCQSVSVINDFLWIGPFQLGINVFLELRWVGPYGISGIMGGLIVSYIATSVWVNPLRAYWLLNGSHRAGEALA